MYYRSTYFSPVSFFPFFLFLYPKNKIDNQLFQLDSPGKIPTSHWRHVFLTVRKVINSSENKQNTPWKWRQRTKSILGKQKVQLPLKQEKWICLREINTNNQSFPEDNLITLKLTPTNVRQDIFPPLCQYLSLSPYLLLLSQVILQGQRLSWGFN